MRRELLHRQYRNRGPLQNYISFYSEWKGRFVLVWIMYLVKAAPVFLIPILTAEVINLITNRTLPQEQIFGRLWEILAIGFVVIVQNIPTHMLYVRLMSVPCRAVEMSLRSALCTRLQHLSIPYHTQTKIGSLQNKVTRDVESIENMTRMLLDTAPHIICTVVIAVIVTLFKAPIFVLFYLAAVPLAVGLYSAVAVIFEVPSGMAADRWGRKNCFLVSQALLLPGLGLLALGQGMAVVQPSAS